MRKVALPHLETNVTSACQLRCTHCNHFVALDASARPKPFMLEVGTFRRDLMNFSRIAHTDAFGFLGGEPTLHPALPELVRTAKDSGIADRYEVWTNGIRLALAFPSDVPFWHSPFDELVVSAYPGQLDDDDVAYLQRMCEAHGKQFRLNDERNRPNFTQLLKKEPGRAQETYDACWFRTFCRVLDNGYLYQCCCGPYVPRLLLGLPEGTDGLRIDEQTTPQDVAAYLGRRDALASCAPCAGRNTADAVPVKWSEERDPVKWLEKSSGRTT